MTSQFGTVDTKFANIEFGVVTEVAGTTEASNTIFFTQAVQLNKTLNFSVEQTINFTESGNRAYPENITSTIVYSHNLTYEKAKHLTANNALMLDDEISVEKIVNRSLISTIGLTQQLSRNIFKLESITHNFNLTQTLVAFVTKSTVNTLVFTQTADYIVSKIGKNNFTLTQSINVNLIVQRDLHDLFEVYQVVQLGPNTLRRDLQHTLGYNQQAVGYAVKGVNQTLSLTQQVIVHNVKGAVNVYNPQQAVNVNIDYKRPIINSLALTHSVLVNKVKQVHAQNSFALSQTTKKTKLIFLETESLFSFNQELVGQRFIENISQSFTITQEAIGQKLVQQTMIDSLNFSHNITMTKILNLSAFNTLIFKSSFKKRVVIGPTIEVNIPEVQIVKVKNLVILRAENRAIVLPAPEFNDSEAGTGSVNILRMKTGGKKVYISDTGKQVLNYDFVIERNKYLELKSFVRAYNSKPIYLENHKGELWYVLFNTNPFSFSEDAYWKDENNITGGNKFSISLSFQGIKLN
jgi:hypothetical protein